MISDGKTKTNFSPGHSRRLDFDPQSFVNVGSWLSAREKRPTVSSSSQTVATPPSASTSQRLVVALLVLVVVLLGTNAYTYRESRGWKAERSALQARVVKLEREAKTANGAQKPTYTTNTGNDCPGGEIIDTCWFKVGLGNCAKGAWVDPIGAAEDVWRQAWDNTVDVVGAVGDMVVQDVHMFGKEIHSFGMATLHFLGVSCGSS